MLKLFVTAIVALSFAAIANATPVSGAASISKASSQTSVDKKKKKKKKKKGGGGYTSEATEI